MSAYGVVSAGHEETVRAAAAILRDDGNAFDAAVAAHFVACVAEPVLASLGGGGFLLAGTTDGRETIYDFFAQTPKEKKPASEIDFGPIDADFGGAVQVFHIGLGSIATPGAVAGLFAVHRDLCRLPMARLMEPAIRLARSGVRVNDFQAHIFKILEPLLRATKESEALFGSRGATKGMLGAGEVLRNPELADTLETLAREGERFFYEGGLAKEMSRSIREGGGHLTEADFAGYRVVRRKPLELSYRDAAIRTNPPPSSGGLLIAFALRILEDFDFTQYDFGSPESLSLLALVMERTNKARIDAQLDGGRHPDADRLLDPVFLARYRREVAGRAASLRGTTHMSVMDRRGNYAGLTVSNGEGCGAVVPGAGFMLNNMLGEEDLNPDGFHRWPINRRMTSMMAPTAVLRKDGTRIVTGSGGSNRLRTAILQVLTNLLDGGLPVEEAVNNPRLHFENGCLDVEPGFSRTTQERLRRAFSTCTVWKRQSMFFGGAHTLACRDGVFAGAGDRRRGGTARVVTTP